MPVTFHQRRSHCESPPWAKSPEQHSAWTMRGACRHAGGRWLSPQRSSDSENKVIRLGAEGFFMASWGMMISGNFRSQTWARDFRKQPSNHARRILRTSERTGHRPNVKLGIRVHLRTVQVKRYWHDSLYRHAASLGVQGSAFVNPLKM